MKESRLLQVEHDEYLKRLEENLKRDIENIDKRHEDILGEVRDHKLRSDRIRELLSDIQAKPENIVGNNMKCITKKKIKTIH